TVASYRIQGFAQAVTSQAQVKTQEQVWLAYSREAAQLASSIQDQLRAIASSRGLTTFNKYAGSSAALGPFWRQMDEAVYMNVDLEVKFDHLVNRLQERRDYLVRVIPVMWDRMLSVRLDSLNLQRAVNAGTVSLQGQSLAEMILKIGDSLNGG